MRKVKELKGMLTPYNNKLLRNLFYFCFLAYSLIIWFYLLNPFRDTAYCIRDCKEVGWMLRKHTIVNMIPFKTITTYIVGFDHYNFDTWFNNIFGNMIIFMPFGFLLPFVFNKSRSFVQNIKISFLVSSGVELLQLIFELGVCDVDDIILNVIGSTIGLYIYKLFIKWVKAINKENIIG